jgi:hypothetical protein
MTINQNATKEELLEAVFSVVHAAATAMQWCSKHVSAAMNQHSIIQQQQKS